MKKILSVCLSLFFFTLVQAQKAQIVYLKDGSTIKGAVTVNDSAGYVLVVDRFKESHYYDKSKVATIVPDTARYNLKRKGYQCTIEMGTTDIIAPRAGVDITAFSLNIINSYLISPIASIGMGVGTEIGSSNTDMFSIYAHERTYFKQTDISPYFDVAFGFNLMFNRGYDYNVYGAPYYYGFHLAVSPDLLFNPALGIRVAVTKKMALNASIGYKLYAFKDDFEIPDAFHNGPRGNLELGHAITIRGGFQF